MVSICPLLWQRDVKLQQTNYIARETDVKMSNIQLWIDSIFLRWMDNHFPWSDTGQMLFH